jgi:hypothetical protein
MDEHQFSNGSPNLNGGDIPSRDQRYLPRWEVRNRVKYAVSESDELNECETRDLSCSGACLKLAQILMPGQAIRMKIFLNEDTIVNVMGHVAWNRIAEDGRYAGIRFDVKSLDAQQELLDYAFEIKPDEVVKHWFSGWDEK